MDAASPAANSKLSHDSLQRMMADMERLRGPLRISVLNTSDGLGIYIPPGRQIAVILFMLVWLAGWAFGMRFAVNELAGGFPIPGLFILIWLIPWTLGGLGVIYVILWQLFGTERIYFTAGALARQRSLLGYEKSKMALSEDIKSVKAQAGGSDLAGLGTISVNAGGFPMRIGSGLADYEAEFVAELIRMAAQAPERETEEADVADEE